MNEERGLQDDYFEFIQNSDPVHLKLIFLNEMNFKRIILNVTNILTIQIALSSI